MKQKIIYNGFEYNLDSVYLVNVNRTSFDHAIVGMTCKQKKFIFNSHPLYEKNFPCVLIPHNWNILQDRDFYLWDNDCELHDKPKKANENRYNFSEGKRRFIYVRKNASRDTSHSKESDIENYRQELREAVRLDKQREIARLEEARLRFQSDVEKVHQEQREPVRLEEEIKVIKPKISQFARLMTPLSRLIPSLFPNKIEKEKERKRLSDERREAIRLRLSSERKRLSSERKRLSSERREAIQLRQEEERKRLSSERRETARLRQEEHKKEEEKRHYEEQMALIKEEEQKQRKRISEEQKQRKRISEEQKQRNILHKSSPQIDELVKIMSNFTLDDKKINKKRIRKSSSNSSPKVIKRRPLKRIRKSNSSGSARRPLKRYKE